jgi:hypothetical protein
MNAATKASNDTLLAFRVAQAEQDKQLEAAVQGVLLNMGVWTVTSGFFHR